MRTNLPLLLVLAASSPTLAAATTQPTGPQDPPLRARIAWQVALERSGFSPGLVDGKAGTRTQQATREFQRAGGLAETGKLDAPTQAALGVEPTGAIRSYTVRQEDLAQLGPAPRSWTGKSQLARLAYPSLEEMLAEKFHCSRALLAELNPGKDLGGLKPGQSLLVPAAAEARPLQGRRIVVDLGRKLVRVVDGSGKTLGLFHCSIAADKAKLPAGRASVAVIARNPTYVFDPGMWPEVKSVRRKLLIPPGPRNPVGLCWIGLSLRGYGIHGTPAPELIGKTGSHGCIRLTNWDALRLGGMVRVGTPVAFVTN
jgi:lipoprotein-anchoring transpeptidase ErfK/SrfK